MVAEAGIPVTNTKDPAVSGTSSPGRENHVPSVMSSGPLREAKDTVIEDLMDTVMEEIDLWLAGSLEKHGMEMQPSLLSPKAVKENLEAPQVEVAS